MSNFRRFLREASKETPAAYYIIILLIGACGVLNMSAVIKFLADAGVIRGRFVPVVTLGTGILTGIIGLRVAYFFWRTGLMKEIDDWLRKLFRCRPK